MIEYFKMGRFRKIVFLITIIAFVGIFLLFQTGNKQNTRKTDVESMFVEENFDETDLTEEEKKHRNMLKAGKLNIPELGLNFIENMEHNKKVIETRDVDSASSALLYIIHLFPVKGEDVTKPLEYFMICVDNRFEYIRGSLIPSSMLLQPTP